MSQNKRSCVLLLRPNAAKITNESILNEGCVCMLSCFGHVFTLCYPVDCSLPVSSPRTPKWAAMPSSRGSSWLRDQTHVSSTSRFSRPVSATWEAPKWRLSNVKWSENKVPLSLQSMLKVKPELFLWQFDTTQRDCLPTKGYDFVVGRAGEHCHLLHHVSF